MARSRADQRAGRGRRLLERRRRERAGRDNVVNVLLGIRRTALATGSPLQSVTIDIIDVNNEPAVVLRVSGRLYGVYACTIAADVIVAIHIVRNPDKLQYLARQLAGGQVQ
jgi:hypothetical protein